MTTGHGRLAGSTAAPQLAYAAKFAALAADLSTAHELDEVSALVLRFATSVMDCSGLTIDVPSKRTPGPGADGPGLLILDLIADHWTIGEIRFRPAGPAGFRPDDVATARLLAAHTALAVVVVRQAGQLASAIESCSLIGQAAGIVMEQRGVDGDTALAMLRRCSQVGNIKLRTIAQSVIATRTLPRVR